MKKQSIIWTALPNGVGKIGASLRLSVFVAPRLQTDEGLPTPRLNQFPDFRDWPAKMAAATFSVKFGNGLPVEARRVVPADAAQASELWGAMFEAQTYVEPWEFPDIGTRPIRSYPVGNVLTHIKQVYQGTAVETPTVVPRIVPEQARDLSVHKLVADVALPAQRRMELRSDVDSHLRTAPGKAVFRPRIIDPTSLKPTIPTRAVAGPRLNTRANQREVDFHLVDDFHRRLSVDKVRPPRKPVVAPDIDFHGIVSSLGQYPAVMRVLGLVVDLEVPVSAAAGGTVSVSVDWDAEMPTTSTYPRTHYLLEGNQFIAASQKGSDIRDGMLKFDDETRFEVGQVDVDGAAIKTLGLAEDVENVTEETDASLPALRSAGIWVARANRAHEFVVTIMPRVVALQNSIQRSRPDESAPEMWAEDLTRGYRIDAMDEDTGTWRSLCERMGEYQFVNGAQGVNRSLAFADEGWVSSAATETTDDATNDLSMHESMFRWEGWSLCGKRPGRPVEADGVPQAQTAKFGLETTFTPKPGSLPKLRFGHSYRVRARVVDLAGNSVPPTVTDATSASDAVEYVRQEPVPTPAIVLRTSADDSPGETLEHLVIRSYNDTQAKDSVPSPEQTQRHIAPPQTSQQMAEMHGKFDRPGGGMQGDAGTYQMLTDNDGTLEKFHDTDQLQLPYLPDPIAVGASIRSVEIDVAPGPEDSVFKVAYDGDWPDTRPFRIRILEPNGGGDAEPQYDEARRLLSLAIGKADVAEVWVSSYVNEPEVARMGVWQWAIDGVMAPSVKQLRLSQPEMKQLRKDMYNPKDLPKAQARARVTPDKNAQLKILSESAIKGIHWMLTPYRKLTLTHAVQQPLIRPVFDHLWAEKEIGNTYAMLQDKFPISGKSTIKVDIHAKWEEPIDPLGESVWKIINGKTHVAEVSAEPEDETLTLSDGASPPTKATPGAARPGIIKPRDTAPTIRRAPAGAVREVAPAVRRGVVRPRAETADVGPVRRVGGRPLLMSRAPSLMTRIDLGHRHEFGDTKYRSVTYTATATTRFREYFPFTDEEIESGDKVITRTSDPVTIDVLNSARPAAPKVLYVIPTFGWTEDQSGAGTSRTRKGGGLRVYLERPWFSSGAGELLGVVLPPQPTRGLLTVRAAAASSVSDELAPYVTQSGADPIWQASGMKSSPTPGDFARGVATENGLFLDELPGQRVTVVGHEVQFDPMRQLWFCDIEIDPGAAYYPFVRLALARYQPKSVQTNTVDCKLSRVLLADFAQLAPDRVAGWAGSSTDKRAFQVSVTGSSYVRSSAGSGPSEMEVVVEASRPNITGPLAWAPVQDGTFPLESRRLNDTTVVWTGNVTIPDGQDPESCRLVVKEYERYTVDGGAARRTTVMRVAPVAAARTNTERRLVYADILHIR